MNFKKIKVKALRFFRSIVSLFSEMNTDSIKAWFESTKVYIHNVVLDLNVMYNDYRDRDERKILGFWMLVMFVPVVFFPWTINLLLIIIFSVFRGYYLRHKNSI